MILEDRVDQKAWADDQCQKDESRMTTPWR